MVRQRFPALKVSETDVTVVVVVKVGGEVWGVLVVGCRDDVVDVERVARRDTDQTTESVKDCGNANV
eukprot:3017812-Amphidinium_carterae.1